jgi:hypothetical protein
MSLSALHSKQLPLDGIHSPISFVYLDQQQRLSSVNFEISDGYKLAMQLDDYTVWMLKDLTPTWERVFSPSDNYNVVVDQTWMVGLENWTSFTSGTASVYSVSPTTHSVFGVIRLDTGDGYTDYAAIGLNTEQDNPQLFNMLLGSNDEVEWETHLKPGPLPEPLRDYTFFAGIVSPDGYSRLGFLIDYQESDGYWCCVSENLQSLTTEITNVMIPDGYWTHLSFKYNNGEVRFDINGSTVASVYSNIPTNIGVFPIFKLQKRLGPMSAKYDLDWIKISYKAKSISLYDPILD